MCDYNDDITKRKKQQHAFTNSDKTKRAASGFAPSLRREVTLLAGTWLLSNIFVEVNVLRDFNGDYYFEERAKRRANVNFKSV